MFAVLILVALVTWSAATVLTATSMHGNDVMRNSHAWDTLDAASVLTKRFLRSNESVTSNDECDGAC